MWNLTCSCHCAKSTDEISMMTCCSLLPCYNDDLLYLTKSRPSQSLCQQRLGPEQTVRLCNV